MDVLSSLLGGESLLDIFSKTINGWFGNLVTSAFEKFDELMVGLLTGVFHFEDLIASAATTVLTKESIRSVYIFIYLLIISLIVLKFMFKGFQIYILWRDGDADASPRDMLVGAIESGAVTVCFPYLYEKATNVFIYIAEGIMAVQTVYGYACRNSYNLHLHQFLYKNGQQPVYIHISETRAALPQAAADVLV